MSTSSRSRPSEFLRLGASCKPGEFHAELERQMYATLMVLRVHTGLVRVRDGYGGCTRVVEGLGERSREGLVCTVQEARALVHEASARVKRVKKGGSLLVVTSVP